MKTIARMPIHEGGAPWIYKPKKYILGEMIYKEDENGHIHTFPTYFDEKVEKEKYYKIMGRKEEDKNVK
tara:strand:- start:869 stop:1075 length:207 start_codon:yes stop_codon:yes gene_type:complete